MHFALFDIVSVSFFLLLTVFFYKKGWFYSFYTFTKFLLISFVALFVGLLAATANPYSFFLTKLQFSLIIQMLTFIMLWIGLSFEKYFFPVTRLFNLTRLMFASKIDRVLTIIPCTIASFFFCFFIFTFFVTLSTRISPLHNAIEASNVTAPMAYKIYALDLPFKGELFNGVAYKLTPATYGDIENNTLPTQTPQQNVPGVQTFSPPTPTATLIPTPTYTPTPIPTLTPTPIPQPTQTIILRQGRTLTALPTSVPTVPPTPAQAPYIPPPTPIPIYQPPAVTGSQAEQDIFRMTNLERAQNGVPPLVWSDTLAAVARAHSQDMVARHFFAHDNPDGLTPFDRMRQAGLVLKAAGENIAAGPTSDIIMRNWMNSEGHKHNILSPMYGKLGVGVITDPYYGLMATQDFSD